MIVNWLKSNVKVIPSVKLGKTFILLPGHNVIDSKEWEVVSKEAGLDKGYEAQYLKVVTDKVDVKQGAVTVAKEVTELKDFGSETAKVVISDMFNIKDLQKLLETSTDPAINYEISKRIDELKSAKGTGKIANRNEK